MQSRSSTLAIRNIWNISAGDQYKSSAMKCDEYLLRTVKLSQVIRCRLQQSQTAQVCLHLMRVALKIAAGVYTSVADLHCTLPTLLVPWTPEPAPNKPASLIRRAASLHKSQSNPNGIAMTETESVLSGVCGRDSRASTAVLLQGSLRNSAV